MTDQSLSFEEFVTHPVTVVSGLLGSLATVWDPAFALATAIWINLGTLMPATSIMATTIAPEVPSIPTQPAKVVMLIIGCLYVAKLLDQAIDKYQERKS